MNTMKPILLLLLASVTLVSAAQAHCGSCSTDEMHGEKAKGGCADAQLADYFKTQEALAADDFSAAQAAASAFLEHAKSMSCSADSEGCCSEELKAAGELEASFDIAAARVAFKAWSDALLAKVEKKGLHGATAHIMHCPMAFNNTGGTWLQASDSLRNPYYGAMMLTCGMKTGTYEASEAGECCGSGASCCSDSKSCCGNGSCEDCKDS